MDHKENYIQIKDSLERICSYITHDHVNVAMYELGALSVTVLAIIGDLDDECDECDCGNNEDETQKDFSNSIKERLEILKQMKSLTETIRDQHKSTEKK